MSIHFHQLRIKSIRKETADSVSILFDVPPELRAAFSFQHGQNITIRSTINDVEVRRSYSICSSAFDDELRVAIRHVDAGQFSTFANTRLQPGDLLDVLPPTGTFNTALDPASSRKYLALVAGSGITPVLSILKTTLHAEPNSQFTLVYGNRTRASIMFFEELEALKNRYMHRLQLIHVLSREITESPINHGRIDIEKLAELSGILDYNNFDEIFICGPEQMIFGSKEYLEQKNIHRRRIHFELFTTPGAARTDKPAIATPSVTEGAETSRIVVRLDGRTFEFDLDPNGLPILDGSLRQGADLPYACKGGVCCTCKARLLEGSVRMDVHWGLEEEEIEQGYVLTCQSHPTSGRVLIDFDVK